MAFRIAHRRQALVVMGPMAFESAEVSFAVPGRFAGCLPALERQLSLGRPGSGPACRLPRRLEPRVKMVGV
jgi:hypothetical protein